MRRRDAEHLLEISGKILDGIESHHRGHLRHIQVGIVRQQLGRPLQTHGPDEFGGGHPGQGLEFPIQVHPVHADVGGQGLHRILGIVHVPLDAFHNPGHEFLVHRGDGDVHRGDVRLPGEGFDPLLALFDEIPDAGLQDFDLEGFGQIGVRPVLIPLQAEVVRGPGRQQDHRDMGGFDILFQGFGHLEAVHLRHHHITDDHVGLDGRHPLQAFFSVGGFFHLITSRQFPGEVLPEFGIVVHQQDPGPRGPRLVRSRFGRCGLVPVLRLLHVFFIHRQVGRQFDPEGGPFPQLGRYRQFAAVHIHVLLDQAEADAGTGTIVARLAPVEMIEDLVQVLFRYADSGVRHFQVDPAVTGIPQLDIDASPLRREFHGIGQEVVQDLLVLRAVIGHDQGTFQIVLIRESYAFPGEGLPERLQRVDREFPDIVLDQVEFFPAHLQPPEIQQVVHQREQFRGIGVDGAQGLQFFRILLFLEQFLQREQDEGQRRTQFVRDIGKEAELHLIQLLLLPALLLLGPFRPFSLFLPGQVERQSRQQQDGQNDIQDPRGGAFPE